MATYGHRGRTCVSHRPRASFNDSCGRACRHNYLAGAQWAALVRAAEWPLVVTRLFDFGRNLFSPHSLFICNGLITALTRSRTLDNDQPMSAVGRCCRKRIYVDLQSNIDSRSRVNAQSRSKNPLVWIRLFQILIPQLLCGDFFDSIGQKRKGSQRTYSVRITPKSGHR